MAVVAISTIVPDVESAPDRGRTASRTLRRTLPKRSTSTTARGSGRAPPRRPRAPAPGGATGSTARPELLERHPGRDVGRGGREHVAPVEHGGDLRRSRPRAGSIWTAWVTPPSASQASESRPLSGPTSRGPSAVFERDRPACRPDARVHDPQRDGVRAGVGHAVGEHHRARLDVVRRDAVAKVDDVDVGGDARDDEVAHARRTRRADPRSDTKTTGPLTRRPPAASASPPEPAATAALPLA